MPTPPLAEKTVTTRPSRDRLACVAGHPLGELAAAARCIGQTGQVVGCDDLAHAGAQGLGQHGDVEPTAQQDDAHLGALDPARAR